MSAVMQAGLRRNTPDNRAFSYAVLASVLLHGVLLFAMPSLREGKRQPVAPGPIVARLVQPQAVAPQAEPPVPQAEPKPQVEPPPPPVVEPIRKPSPIAKAAPKEPPKPAPVQPAPAAAEPPPAAPPPASAATAPGPVAKIDPQAGPPSADAVDTGSLARYRVDVATQARRFKRYPRVAMDNSWEGRVVVGVTVRANGINASYSVLVSSGHEILDKQAVDMVTKARPRAEIPAALRGREFTFEIPVTFDLKEPDA